jgi:hypothetical protein
VHGRAGFSARPAAISGTTAHIPASTARAFAVEGVFKAADSRARIATMARAACMMSACVGLLVAALAPRSTPAMRIAAALDQFPAQSSRAQGRLLPDARFASGLFVFTPPHVNSPAERRP